MNRSISCRLLCQTTMLLVLLTAAPDGLGQPEPATLPAGPPPAQLNADDAIKQLREGLIGAFNKQDIDQLLTYLAPDVVVTWQNAEVCRGPAAVKSYYDKMMKGDKPVVAKIESNPVVDGRQIYGDWAISYGHMNDHFQLTDGSDLPFDSRFTVTTARHGDRWLVDGFHVSVNAFNNPVLGYAVKKGVAYGALGGALAGLIVGVVAGIFFGRRRTAA